MLARALGAAVLSVLALVGAGCGIAAPPSPTPGLSNTADVPTAAAPVADPVKVSIAALHVTDELVPVELAADGEMELPPVEKVGWYSLAPRPGEQGYAAVLAGHVDYNGVPGAFKHLGTLKPGDPIEITDKIGTVRTFRVYHVEQIPKAQYSTRTVPLIFDPVPVGETRIALVTCSGTVVNKEYLDNTVVLAH